MNRLRLVGGFDVPRYLLAEVYVPSSDVQEVRLILRNASRLSGGADREETTDDELDNLGEEEEDEKQDPKDKKEKKQMQWEETEESEFQPDFQSDMTSRAILLNFLMNTTNFYNEPKMGLDR